MMVIFHSYVSLPEVPHSQTHSRSSFPSRAMPVPSSVPHAVEQLHSCSRHLPFLGLATWSVRFGRWMLGKSDQKDGSEKPYINHGRNGMVTWLPAISAISFLRTSSMHCSIIPQGPHNRIGHPTTMEHVDFHQRWRAASFRAELDQIFSLQRLNVF